MNVMTETERYYGYLIALGLQNDTGQPNAEPRHLYAMFEYGGRPDVWVVPDAELFAALAPHLVAMAKTREAGDPYGYNKLWISKQNGKWIVELP